MALASQLIGVIGCGTMGNGIAQVALHGGHKVVVYDTNAEALTKAKAALSAVFAKLCEKGKLSNEQSQVMLGNVVYSQSLNDLHNAGLIIEAIVEDTLAKHQLFKALESIVGNGCIIGTNTSSLSITSLAAALRLPSRFIGIHFFNPAPIMPLVEIVPGLTTDDSIVTMCVNMMLAWHKLPVIAKDTPGFIVNRIARPYYGEALRIYEEGIGDFATIDGAMKNCGGFKMGPFELMDMIGNDVNYKVTESVWTQMFYDGRYKPSLTQKRLFEAGYYGRKSGRGYYDYTTDVVMDADTSTADLQQQIFKRILSMLINEAAESVHLRIASKDDIETAMTKGVNYPKGLLQWADEWGIDNCVSTLDNLFNTYHEERYRCSTLLRSMAQRKATFF